MKLSAWHKRRGDTVEWYDSLTVCYDPPNRVYMGKVFTFTPDFPHPVNADRVIKGGTGYHYLDGGIPLPQMIEHIYPDYGLYPEIAKDTAYAMKNLKGDRNGRKTTNICYPGRVHYQTCQGMALLRRKRD